MAEINVQGESPSAIWWVVGTIALVLLIWLLFAWVKEPTATRIPEHSTPMATLLLDGHMSVANPNQNVGSVGPVVS